MQASKEASMAFFRSDRLRRAQRILRDQEDIQDLHANDTVSQYSLAAAAVK